MQLMRGNSWWGKIGLRSLEQVPITHESYSALKQILMFIVCDVQLTFRKQKPRDPAKDDGGPETFIT